MTRLIDKDETIKQLEFYERCTGEDLTQAKFYVNLQPTVEPTLYGYKIEHLALIARVMEKDGVTPEIAVQIFTDVQTIALKVLDEINGIIERTFEQAMETGNGDAEPVVHGRWIRDEFGTKCGACNLYAYRDKFDQPWESPYCPNCGADMRGEHDG